MMIRTNNYELCYKWSLSSWWRMLLVTHKEHCWYLMYYYADHNSIWIAWCDEENKVKYYDVGRWYGQLYNMLRNELNCEPSLNYGIPRATPKGYLPALAWIPRMSSPILGTDLLEHLHEKIELEEDVSMENLNTSPDHSEGSVESLAEETASAVKMQVSKTRRVDMASANEKDACVVAEREKKARIRKYRVKDLGSMKEKRNSIVMKCFHNIDWTLPIFVPVVMACIFFKLMNSIPAVSGSPLVTSLVSYHIVSYPDSELILTIPGFYESSKVIIIQNLIDAPIRVDRKNWLNTTTNSGNLTVTIKDVSNHTGHYSAYDLSKGHKIIADFYVNYTPDTSMNFTGKFVSNSTEEVDTTVDKSLGEVLKIIVPIVVIAIILVLVVVGYLLIRYKESLGLCRPNGQDVMNEDPNSTTAMLP